MTEALPFARGAALVERIVARIGPREDAVPFGGPYTFPDGRALPPSLARFLRFDARWLLDGTALTPRPLPEAWAECVRRIRRQDAEEAAAWVRHENEEARRAGGPPPFAEDLEVPPPSSDDGAAERVARSFTGPVDGACYLLPTLGTHPHLLYVGVADDAGEYPVLAVGPKSHELFLAFPGLDFYLNHRFGAVQVDVEAPWYQRLLEGHARANLGGQRFVLEGADAASDAEAPDDIPF